MPLTDRSVGVEFRRDLIFRLYGQTSKKCWNANIERRRSQDLLCRGGSCCHRCGVNLRFGVLK